MARIATLDKQVDAWLKEYEACHATKYHYDSVRWTIAAIFIGFSLTAIGVSFVQGAFFSILLLLIAMAFYFHVNPWIETAQDRLWEIEAQLGTYGIQVNLHNRIRAKSGRFEGRGTMITVSLIVIVVGFWTIRVVVALIGIS